MAHEAIVAGRKGNNFQITRCFQNSILALLTLIPNPVLEELKQMQETFLWEEISGQKYSMIHYVKTLLKMVLEVWTKNINFDIKMFLDTIAI